jgi:hypothetical protein
MLDYQSAEFVRRQIIRGKLVRREEPDLAPAMDPLLDACSNAAPRLPKSFLNVNQVSNSVLGTAFQNKAKRTQ